MALGVAGWYQAVGEVAASVPCGGETHRVVWRRGKVVLLDHDLRAEEVAAALGGEPPACLEVLQAWRRSERTARMVKIDADTLEYFRSRNLTLGSQFHAALLPEALREIRERTTWLHELRSSAGARVLAGKKDRGVVNTLRRHASAAVRASLSAVDPWFDIEVSLQPVAAGAPPSVRVRPATGRRQTADVSLPITWLATVALLGVTNVGDRFVLAVRHAEPPFTMMVVDTLRWVRTPADRLGAETETARIERGADGSWQLHEAWSPQHASEHSSR